MEIDEYFRFYDQVLLKNQEYLSIIYENYSLFFRQNLKSIVVNAVEDMIEHIPSYTEDNREELMKNINDFFGIFLDSLQHDNKSTLTFVKNISNMRARMNFPVYDSVTGLVVIQRSCITELINSYIEKKYKYFPEMVNIITSWFEIVIYYWGKNHYTTLQDLVRTQKDELSHFAYILAHDLRNYFMTINGYAELIPDHKNLVKKIIELTQKANDFVTKSLELAQAGEIVSGLGKIDLEEIVLTARNLVPFGSIKLLIMSLPKVSCDDVKMVQVFKNIFENIVIHGKPSFIEVKTQKFKNLTRLSIINDGLPMPESMIIFLNDESLAFDTKKRGFGLQIIKRIIQAHKWSIHAENANFPKIEIDFKEDS